MKPIVFVMAAMAAMASAPACASNIAASVEQAAETLKPNTFVWDDPGNAEPVTIVVSIPQQLAFVYRGDMLVAASSVSTGKDGKDTPTGVYPILQKSEDHKSNLYNSAPMPFMQRLTWDGIALHAGRNPGFPASHGCVRLPTAFARQLFGITDIGTTVVVTDQYVFGQTLDRDLVTPEHVRANMDQIAALP